MDTPDSPIVDEAKEQLNNNSDSRRGFASHPENINKNGAPKRQWTWEGTYQKAVDKSADDGRPVKEHVAEALIAEALKGNVNAIKELADRMDGKPDQRTDITSGGDKLEPIQVIIKDYGVDDNSTT